MKEFGGFYIKSTSPLGTHRRREHPIPRACTLHSSASVSDEREEKKNYSGSTEGAGNYIESTATMAAIEGYTNVLTTGPAQAQGASYSECMHTTLFCKRIT